MDSAVAEWTETFASVVENTDTALLAFIWIT